MASALASRRVEGPDGAGGDASQEVLGQAEVEAGENERPPLTGVFTRSIDTKES